MIETVDKAEFFARVIRSRQEWENAILQTHADEMILKGFCGDWPLKDVIAHITWYEREMVNLLQAKRFAGSDRWAWSLEDRNRAIFEENRDRGLEDIMGEAQQVFEQLMRLMLQLSDDELNSPNSFPGMPPEWRPWQVLASNTYEHYEGHLCHAKAWNAKRAASKAEA